jgi:hypothetical protein
LHQNKTRQECEEEFERKRARLRAGHGG